jgi:hypothetical protein
MLWSPEIFGIFLTVKWADLMLNVQLDATQVKVRPGYK